MGSKVKNRCAIPVPRPTSILETQLFNPSGPPVKMTYYEHRLDRPMELVTMFEMSPENRTKYLTMLNNEFGFELQDYMSFFRADKVSMYNILKDANVKLKRTGGMSGSQENRWKKFLAMEWEQRARPIELCEPIIRELRAKSGVYNGTTDSVIVPTDEEVENLYKSEPVSEPKSVLSEESSEPPRFSKQVIISEFDNPDVELRLDLRLTRSAAEELIDRLFERKYTGPGDIKSISVVLPPISKKP